MNSLSSFLGWRRPNWIDIFESLRGVMGWLFVCLFVVCCPSCYKLAQLTLSLLWNSHRNSFEIVAFSTQRKQPQFCCCCCLFINSTQPPSLECIQTMKGTAQAIQVRVEANQTQESTSTLLRRLVCLIVGTKPEKIFSASWRPSFSTTEPFVEEWFGRMTSSSCMWPCVCFVLQ